MKKALQIEYEPERDRLTLDGWDIHCGQPLEVLLPNQLNGGTWREISIEYSYTKGWYIPGHQEVNPIGLWAREREV